MKLLINTPLGKQEVIVLGEGGGYFDATRVLWDESKDGPMPAITVGGMKRVGASLVFDQAIMDATSGAELAELKKNLVENVDTTIAGIYSRWLRFEAEYVEREAAARAFKATSYQGDPGVWVTAFATSAGMAANVASDLIISQADNLHAALEALGALRMSKYGIQAAVTISAAKAAHNAIITQAMAIASGL